MRLRLGFATLLLTLPLVLTAAGCAGGLETQSDRAGVADSLSRQVLVTLPLGDPAQALASAKTLGRDHGLLLVGKWRLRSIGLFCAIYQIPDQRSVATVVSTLSADPMVHDAQPVQTFRILGEANPDPYLHLQHGLTALRVDAAHQVSRGAGTVVAVIDTGVDLNHPDLSGQVVEAKNFVDEAEEGFKADRHGTGVAGVIGATANNGIGITGVAPEAKLWALKACWREAALPAALCSSFTLAKALDFAVRGEVNVINLSLEGPGDAVLTALVNAAVQRDIVVVAASGQAGAGGGFPANLPVVMGVRTAGAHKGDSEKALPAPGTNVITTVPHGTYDLLSGSSLAAAHVSGAAALMLSAEPRLDPTQLRTMLSSSLRVVNQPDGRRYTVLDLSAAVSALKAMQL